MPKTDPLVPILTYRAPTATPAPSVVVDVERLIASRMLVQANSGAGKSRAIRQLLEETHGRVQHLVLDPEGEFATLRERFDYVLAAPKDGDVVATPKTARLLCRRLVELGASAVLDVYDLPLEGRREFVKLFLTELMALPRALWRPILVVIDEAHVFAPQAGESQSLEAVTALCTQGRKRGFAAVLATQRIAKLHKDAAAELLNKLIGRTGLDVDVKRAGEELGFDKEQRAGLKTLEPGEFFAYGPAIANAVQRVRTGPVVTSHPEAGRVSVAPPPAPERVRTVLAQLADLAQKAEEEARTIEDLERRNRELTAQVRKLERGGAERIVEKPVLDQAALDRRLAEAFAGFAREHRNWERVQRKRLETVQTSVGRAATQLAGVVSLLNDAGHGLEEAIGTLHEGPVPGKPAIVAPERSIVASKVPVVARTASIVAARTPRAAAGPGESLPVGERKILIAVAQYPDGVSREQLTILTGYKRSSRDTYLQRLGARGYVDTRGGTIVATDDGVAALGDFELLPTGDALLEYWRGRLPEGERRVLDVVVNAWPAEIPREAIDRATDYKRSSRDTYLQRLGSRKLITTERGTVRASDTLFD